MAKPFPLLLDCGPMLGAAVGLLLVGAGVGLHLEQVAELTLEDASALAFQLGQALEPRVGGAPVIDDPLWPECARPDRCVDEVRLRTRAQELVYLRVLGGPTKIRLIAERLEPGRSHPPITRNLTRERVTWAPELAALALALYPVALARAPDESAVWTPPPPPPPAETNLVPLIPLGVGVAAAAVGVGFGLSSRALRQDLENGAIPDAEYDREVEHMRAHGLVANLLFGTAAVAGATALILWLTTD